MLIRAIIGIIAFACFLGLFWLGGIEFSHRDKSLAFAILVSGIAAVFIALFDLIEVPHHGNED